MSGAESRVWGMTGRPGSLLAVMRRTSALEPQRPRMESSPAPGFANPLPLVNFLISLNLVSLINRNR